jgi:ABC-type thiamin/hydroxymethylpyrimidine transport system permease subunit
MKWFLRSCFLLAFVVLPVTVHANPVPSTAAACTACVKAPEFDLATVYSGMAVFAGAGWVFLRRLRRNRRG